METTDLFESFTSPSSTTSSFFSNVTDSATSSISQFLPDISSVSAEQGNDWSKATTGGGGTSNGSWNVTDDMVSSFWRVLYDQYELDPKYDWKIPQYYSLPYQIIGTLFQGIIFIVGM